MNMQKILNLALLLFIVSSTGCAYRYYLGMHGPSIRNSPETHLAVKKDEQCLGCHNPDMPTEAPPTDHPHFKGCLGCHDDALK